MDFTQEGSNIVFMEPIGRDLAGLARNVPEQTQGTEMRVVEAIRNESNIISGLRIIDSANYAGGAYGYADNKGRAYDLDELCRIGKTDVKVLKRSLGYAEHELSK